MVTLTFENNQQKDLIVQQLDMQNPDMLPTS